MLSSQHTLKRMLRLDSWHVASRVLYSLLHGCCLVQCLCAVLSSCCVVS